MSRSLALIALGAALAAAPALLAQGTGGQQPPAPNPPAPSPHAAPPPQSAPPSAAEPEEGEPLSKLGLSDEQKKQIHSIRRQAQDQVQAVKNDASLTSQQQTRQIRQIRRTEFQQMDAVLTPGQREQFEAWRKSRHQHHRQPPSQQPGPA